MASTAPSGNGTAAEATESEIPATAAVETGGSEAAAGATAAESVTAAGTKSPEKKWPGWPGDCVFRLIVPVLKVGSIIGRKGDLIKKMCEETKARIRVLEGPVGNPDRIVLISGKEETDSPMSPAMDAVMRVFKRINGFPENEGDSIASVPFCSIRLLVPSMQAISLIGKQGASIKAIQESTGCSVRVLSGDEVSAYAGPEDRVVDMQGEAIKVLKALEAVVGHLRKFLVDRSVLPLFEKTHNATATQERQVETWADKPVSGLGGDYPLSIKRETLFLDREPSRYLEREPQRFLDREPQRFLEREPQRFLDREPQRFLDREPQREPQLSSSGLSMYGRDPGLSTARSPALASRTGGPFVTQVAQTMQIPLIYAEDIIGVGGTNIAYIRRTSGAILTVQESRGLPDEITVEIKGTSLQVQTAQQLIQDCVNSHKESVPGGYSRTESGLRSSYSQLGNSSYPSSYGGHSYGGGSGGGGGGYGGASGLGGEYGSYRM